MYIIENVGMYYTCSAWTSDITIARRFLLRWEAEMMCRLYFPDAIIIEMHNENLS